MNQCAVCRIITDPTMPTTGICRTCDGEFRETLKRLGGPTRSEDFFLARDAAHLAAAKARGVVR